MSINNTATTQLYTLSLHDALPIFGPIGSSTRRATPAISASDAGRRSSSPATKRWKWNAMPRKAFVLRTSPQRSEEHTSELQSRFDLVCRLLLEKKKHLL